MNEIITQGLVLEEEVIQENEISLNIENQTPKQITKTLIQSSFSSQQQSSSPSQQQQPIIQQHSSSNQSHIISQTSHILHSPSLIHASTFMVLLQGHENNIPDIDISGCGKFLCSCSIDGTFLVWMIGLPMHPPMWFKSRDVTKQGKRSGLQREKKFGERQQQQQQQLILAKVNKDLNQMNEQQTTVTGTVKISQSSNIQNQKSTNNKKSNQSKEIIKLSDEEMMQLPTYIHWYQSFKPANEQNLPKHISLSQLASFAQRSFQIQQRIRTDNQTEFSPENENICQTPTIKTGFESDESHSSQHLHQSSKQTPQYTQTSANSNDFSNSSENSKSHLPIIVSAQHRLHQKTSFNHSQLNDLQQQ